VTRRDSAVNTEDTARFNLADSPTIGQIRKVLAFDFTNSPTVDEIRGAKPEARSPRLEGVVCSVSTTQVGLGSRVIFQSPYAQCAPEEDCFDCALTASGVCVRHEDPPMERAAAAGSAASFHDIKVASYGRKDFALPFFRMSHRFDPLQSVSLRRFTSRPGRSLITTRGAARVDTLYKKKALKVLPLNIPRPTSGRPGGDPKWREKALAAEEVLYLDRPPAKLDRWLIPRFSQERPGIRLTEERKAGVQIGEEITDAERKVFFQMLQNREMALAWKFSEIGRVKDEVSPPLEILTGDHTPWQAKNFAIPRALRPKVIQML
jgi:hypothetical protein